MESAVTCHTKVKIAILAQLDTKICMFVDEACGVYISHIYYMPL